ERVVVHEAPKKLRRYPEKIAQTPVIRHCGEYPTLMRTSGRVIPNLLHGGSGGVVSRQGRRTQILVEVLVDNGHRTLRTDKPSNRLKIHMVIRQVKRSRLIG